MGDRRERKRNQRCPTVFWLKQLARWCTPFSKTWEDQMGWGLLQKLSFEHVKFEMCIIHPTGHPKWMAGYRSLNFSEVLRARDGSLEVKIHQHKESI